MPDIGKVMLDFEVIHCRLLGNDRLQQNTQIGNVPLAIAKRVEQTTARLLGLDVECGIEGAACGQNTIAVVKHDEGLGDRIDDRLRKRLRMFNF